MTGLSSDPRPSLPDQEARDRITGELDRTLFVEAGAGSGKTSSLVDRIVNMVDHGRVPVHRIAAITFTEAAARELRTRVRDAMVSRRVPGAGDVESAAFTTLHGFALRILTDHAIEAGLPPGFGVVDEITSALEFERDWRLFIGHVGDDLGLLELQQRAAALSIRLDSFSTVAKSFDDNWDLLESFDELVEGRLAPLSDLGTEALLDRIIELEQVTSSCISDGDKMCAAIIDVANQARALVRSEPLVQLRNLESLKLPGRIGVKTNWREPGIEHVRSRIGDLKADIGAHLGQLRHEVISRFVILVAAHVLRRVRSRQDNGQLSFHDLLVLARRLLRNDETVRRTLHQRYSRILLDEFQDTDPIQIELAVLLAHPGPVAGRSWQELAGELPAGRLVVVGDPKQAIYRFRRADIRVYAETGEVLDTEPTKLVTNFRSVPGIVAWVNELFGSVIGDGVPEAQPAYTALAAARASHPDIDVPVTVLGHPHDKSFGVGQIRELEAADVAAVVCRIMEEEWPVLSEGGGNGSDGRPAKAGWRPAQLRDIAVLIPSRLSLPALEAAFTAANVPFRPETNSLVYATQEVRDLIAGIRAVVEPTSSVDVVAALRSNLFAVTDRDLLAWKLAGGGWDYRSPWPDGSGRSPVALAYESLRAWHRERWWTEPAGLIDRMVRERRLRELALAESRPRDRWRRYRFLTEQARQFTETQGGDLQDFVDWVEIQSSDVARVTEPVPPEPDDDAVRVLTIHGAKGLEFPIAVLAGAPTGEGNRRPGPQVLFTAEGRPEVKLGKDKRTSGFDLRASVEDILDEHERIRLHYVAATRARDHLIVSAHHKEGMTSIGCRTWQAVQGRPELWRPFERRGDERYDSIPATQLRFAAADYDGDLVRWQSDQDRLVSAAGVVRMWSPSRLAEAHRGSGGSPDPAPIHIVGYPGPTTSDSLVVDDDAPATGLVAGMAADYDGSTLGTAVHHVLERFPLDVGPGDARCRSEVRRLAARWSARTLRRFESDEAVDVDRLASEVEARVWAALNSSTFELARAHPARRELAVGIPTGTGTIEGFIDLCIESPDGLIVVDYKTDRVADDELDRFAAAYRIQLAAYALMLETVASRPVVDCRLLLLRSGDAIELSIADLGAAVNDVRRLLDLAPGGDQASVVAP